MSTRSIFKSWHTYSKLGKDIFSQINVNKKLRDYDRSVIASKEDSCHMEVSYIGNDFTSISSMSTKKGDKV